MTHNQIHFMNSLGSIYEDRSYQAKQKIHEKGCLYGPAKDKTS